MKLLGDIIIDAVIRAGALDRAEIHGGSQLLIWHANAAEQIEAALQDDPDWKYYTKETPTPIAQ